MTDPASTTTTAFDLGSQGCLALGRRALHQLRATLEREGGVQAATWLQEAGFAAGDDLYRAFGEWLRSRTDVQAPADLDPAAFTEAVSAFFRELGWGTLALEHLASGIVAFAAPDWSEADAEAETPYPTCHLTSGVLAAFISQLAGAPAAAMEVECRSRGEPGCRWLVGSPETLAALYEQLARGRGWREVLQAG